MRQYLQLGARLQHHTADSRVNCRVDHHAQDHRHSLVEVGPPEALLVDTHGVGQPRADWQRVVVEHREDQPQGNCALRHRVQHDRVEPEGAG